jgi:hypothetical protein
LVGWERGESAVMFKPDPFDSSFDSVELQIRRPTQALATRQCHPMPTPAMPPRRQNNHHHQRPSWGDLGRVIFREPQYGRRPGESKPRTGPRHRLPIAGRGISMAGCTRPAQLQPYVVGHDRKGTMMATWAGNFRPSLCPSRLPPATQRLPPH